MKKNNPALYVDVLILGGGLTGLSTAYHLEKQKYTDYLLVEKNSFFGGLCASEQINGFTFDYSGHLIHLHEPYTQKLVKKLLRGNLIKHQRQAWIDFDGQRIPFPFQANLWALPPDKRQNCLSGLQRAAAEHAQKPKNFEQWCLQAFGDGIYRYFLKPYNTKLWQTDLKKLTWDWCGPFVPRPNLQQLIAAAARPPKIPFGYNSCFYYPRRGGCGALAQALSAHIPNTWLQAEVQQIDLQKKYALINGRTVYFKQLLNTLPLPVFIKLCKKIPAGISQAAKQLKSVPVHVLQLAINRAVKPFHWIYFPQPQIPFFRVGMQSAFSPENAPRNTSSFYVETSQNITDFKKAQKAFIKYLSQKGIIEKQDKIICAFWRTLSPAYTLYDFKRSVAQKRIIKWLKAQDCLCAGRYGLWEYSFIERSLLQGKEAASQFILGRIK